MSPCLLTKLPLHKFSRLGKFSKGWMGMGMMKIGVEKGLDEKKGHIRFYSPRTFIEKRHSLCKRANKNSYCYEEHIRDDNFIEKSNSLKVPYFCFPFLLLFLHWKSVTDDIMVYELKYTWQILSSKEEILIFGLAFIFIIENVLPTTKGTLFVTF